MKLWIDDVRKAPEGYIWCKTVNEAKNVICDELTKFRHGLKTYIMSNKEIPEKWFEDWIIDLDHDAGEYVNEGGDYIKLLDWLEWLFSGNNPYILFHIHSKNPVGIENMRRIIQRNGWKEI